MEKLIDILAFLTKNPELTDSLIKKVKRTFGAVHKATPAVMNGNTGFLIWDYIVFNEITFLNDQTGTITSLFTSFSDEETDNRFDEFKSKYGS